MHHLGARKTVADQKNNRGIRPTLGREKVQESMGDVVERAKRGICKEIGHWHK